MLKSVDRPRLFHVGEYDSYDHKHANQMSKEESLFNLLSQFPPASIVTSSLSFA